MKPIRPPRPAGRGLLLFGAVALCACGGDDEARHSTPTAAPRRRPRRSTRRSVAARRTSTTGRWPAWAATAAHVPTATWTPQNFQLTPAAAQARLAQMTASGVDDPLFRAIDADDFRVNGAAAHDFTNLTQNGLIRVTIPLPANVKLLDCGATIPCPASARPTSETVADVWRAVPPILDVKITGPDGAGPVSDRGPNRSGGYQLDGRIDTLQNQALSALQNHAATAVNPPASFLDDLAAFQQHAVLVAECQAALRRDDGRHQPAARSRSRPECPRSVGQARLQPGVRPVPRRRRRPSEHHHPDPAGSAGHAHQPDPLPRRR